MKKYLISLILSLSILSGCTSSLEKISNTAMDIAIPIPKNVEENMLSQVNLESQLYGIGTAVIGDSSISFAYEKAILNSKEKLRDEMIKESNLIFKSYTLDMDSHRKTIFNPIIPELVNSTVNSQLNFSQEKRRLDDGRKVYVLFTIDRKLLKAQSDKVFLEYLDDLIGRLNSSKSEIRSQQF